MALDESVGVARRPRILVVDDEPLIRAALVRLLGLDGLDTGEAGSGPEALAALAAGEYDVMIVDLNLPGMDGSEVMQRARQQDPDLRIVVLTGHATLDSAITAVKVEAVDYLQKPASLQEISTVVRRALRSRADELQRRRLLSVIGEAVEVLRSPGPGERTDSGEPATASASAGRPTLASDRRQLRLPGDPERVVELTESETAVLGVLMSKPNQALSCREIARVAWTYDVEEWEAQSLVRPHVFRLRQKIEIDPDKPRWIKTLRGRGYLFSAGD